MRGKKIIKASVILLAVVVLTAAGISIYLYNKPHRNVLAAPVDFKLTSADLVAQYLTNPDEANRKYLRDNGKSGIMAVTGKVHAIARDMNNQRVVLLKDKGEKAGVSCTFTPATSHQAEDIQVGQSITVKGVIRSGARYDEDFGLYEDVILEKCSVL
jgi:hypothetical protein